MLMLSLEISEISVIHYHYLRGSDIYIVYHTNFTTCKWNLESLKNFDLIIFK